MKDEFKAMDPNTKTTMFYQRSSHSRLTGSSSFKWAKFIRPFTSSNWTINVLLVTYCIEKAIKKNKYMCDSVPQK